MCQNVSKKVSLIGVIFQAKVPSHSGFFVLAEQQNYTFPLRMKELRDIGHSMTMTLDTRKSDFEN